MRAEKETFRRTVSAEVENISGCSRSVGAGLPPHTAPQDALLGQGDGGPPPFGIRTQISKESISRLNLAMDATHF